MNQLIWKAELLKNIIIMLETAKREGHDIDIIIEALHRQLEVLSEAEKLYS